ncbi:hypothetical protein PCANC_24224 [Puccinia coronata f. sp. avenae]|uniref:Uncharacterized protein n=1 Tax=Puccinia coronata f. sp. avenae TaxID=200324 RepID=A0A2N5S3G3_9BASI|nr:hypothetical protein PCANC_24224 [Puccinia coronata f. sp. avenae]
MKKPALSSLIIPQIRPTSTILARYTSTSHDQEDSSAWEMLPNVGFNQFGDNICAANWDLPMDTDTSSSMNLPSDPTYYPVDSSSRLLETCIPPSSSSSLEPLASFGLPIPYFTRKF